MRECIFCNNPGTILCKNEGAYSVLNFTPAVPGHFLIVPHRHVESIPELGDECAGFFHLVDTTINLISARISEGDTFLIDFYQDQKKKSPFLYSDEYTEENRRYLARMAEESRNLNPPIGYNIGYNREASAGQREKHLHIHVFPRYTEGRGVVAAMRKLIFPV